MVERTPFFNIFTHVVLSLALLMMLAPMWIVFVASTHDLVTVMRVPMPLLPGSHFLENLRTAWNDGGFGPTIVRSMIVSVCVAAGKIVISSLSAFSIVYFRYRARVIFFWLIYGTLMLPLEVRIIPTYAVAANAFQPFQDIVNLLGFTIQLPEWSLINSYTGLVLPVIATATGTFLYRQFFLTIPDELTEAAKLDGAGPIRFYLDVVMPLSRANIIAIGSTMFIGAWNQYLWPLLIITDRVNMSTATMQLQRIVPGGHIEGELPTWNIAMAGTLIVMIPPVILTVLLQRWILRSQDYTEK